PGAVFAGADEPRATPIRRAAVIGAGFMGGAIASELALRVPSLQRVRLWDASPGAAERAAERGRDVARLLAAAGVLAAKDAETRLRRLQPASTLAEALDGAEYVAEAVPE